MTVASRQREAQRKFTLKPAAYPIGRLILGTVGMIFVLSMVV